jgi:anaerobic magnesium-protoporphyrin IX monomethyl ester cyclase
MKTVLINPMGAYGVIDNTTYKLLEPGGSNVFPLGLGYIAAVLEKRHDVRIIDMGAEGLNHDLLRKRVAKIRPEIVGITADTLAFQRALDIAEIVKHTDKKITVVIGGAHSNALPAYPLNYDCFDISVHGEGEGTAVELWDRIDRGISYEDVRGISFRGKNSVVINPARELIENLDALPFPARHLFPMDRYSGEKHLSVSPIYPVNTSRGCPFACAFCSHNVGFGRRYRARGPKSVLDEIEMLINQYRIRGIYFRENLFTANRQRVMGICDEIGKRSLDFKWECNSRVNTMDEEMLQAMKAAGCELVWCGFESGSQRVLDILNKQITVSQTREACNLCHKVGIRVGSTFMIGTPGETMDDIQQTIDFVEELKPKLEWSFFHVYTPYPVSPLYEFIKKNRLYESEINHGFLMIKTAEFTRGRLEEIQRYIHNRLMKREDRRELPLFGQYDQQDNARDERLELISNLVEGHKVLQLYCGSGDISMEIAGHGYDVVGVGASESVIQRVAGSAGRDDIAALVRFVEMDPVNLEFPDNCFDTVLLTDTLAYIRDTRRLLDEATRVVRNGGRVIISVPNVLIDPFSGVRFPGHLRVFFKDTLAAELAKYTGEITWHDLPSNKWLVCSFFIRKAEKDVKDGPLVDIIMPTYNGRSYIKDAISSVLNQTYQNWNLWIINDGGEEIADIAGGFRDGRIRCISSEHRGKAHALNLGINSSSGEYITCLDDDDIAYPLHLELLLKAALDGRRDFVYSDWYEVSLNEGNKESERHFKPIQEIAPRMLISSDFIAPKPVLYSRRSAVKAGFYDEGLDILMDWDLIRRLSFISEPYHVSAATGERLIYQGGQMVRNRISRLPACNPDKVRRSVEKLVNKTGSLPASAAELKAALEKAQLSLGHYHKLQLSEALRGKDAQIGELRSSLQAGDGRIADLGNALLSRDAEIAGLQLQIRRMNEGIVMQLARRYQAVIEKTLPRGTRLRRLYELVLSGIRTILNYGWKTFWHEFRRWRAGGRS